MSNPNLQQQAEDGCSTCLLNRTCIVQDEQFEETKPEDKEKLAWLEDRECKQLKEVITHQEELIRAMGEGHECLMEDVKAKYRALIIVIGIMAFSIGFTIGVVFI